jgi:tight adherence protein B
MLGQLELLEIVLMLCTGGAVAAFALVGIDMFSKGWEGYEQKYVKGAERSLDDMYLSIPIQHLVYLSVCSALVLSVLVGLLFGSWVLGVLGGMVGLAVPEILVRWLRHRRLVRFGYQLVDALSNISNSLKAGFSLPQAFQLLQQEMPNPISQEFRLVNQELRVGVPMEEALGHLVRRIDSDDVDLVVTAIGISREVGGNLTEVFDNIADTIRERHKMEGKIRALTAQGKAQAFIICMLPIAMMMVLNYTNPELVQPLFHRPLGWLILGLIFLLELFGILIIRKIVQIDV